MLKEPGAKNVGGDFGEYSSFFGIFRFPGWVVIVEARAVPRAHACIGGVPGLGQVVPARGQREARGAAARVVAGAPRLVQPVGVAGERGGRPADILQQERNISTRITKQQYPSSEHVFVWSVFVWHSRFVICAGSHGGEWWLLSTHHQAVFTPS